MYFRLLLMLSATALGGCGLVPPAVSIASFAADAFSYAVSGKSVSDHGLSMVLQEDCAVLNFVKGAAICAPGPHPEIKMVAPRDPDGDRLYLASAESQDDAEDGAAHWEAPASPALPVEQAAAGPLLDAPIFQPASLRLEPVASGLVDVIASTALEPGKPPA